MVAPLGMTGREPDSGASTGRRILYIEDSPADYALARAMLTKSGTEYRLAGESTLRAGIARLRHDRFDAILLDLLLPDGPDGLDNIQSVRDVCGDETPVIVVTGNEDERLAAAALEHGAQDYLVKGAFTPDLLCRAIRHSVERHKLMKRIRRNRQAILRQERLASIGTLAAGIAHEINNPVGASLLAAETALELIDAPSCRAHLRESLENIIDAMDRCGQIVRNTLKFSRDESGERTVCDINRIARRSLDLVRVAAERSRAGLRLLLDESLPPVVANQLELELVLVNLINNAIQSRNESVLIEIETQGIDDGIRIIVRDDGPGMNEEQRRHAFDPFYTTKRHSGGTGLGLSIVHGIIEDHDGEIDILSQPGEGTAVRITIPVESVEFC